MKILAIDTSAKTATAALTEDKALLARMYPLLVEYLLELRIVHLAEIAPEDKCLFSARQFAMHKHIALGDVPVHKLHAKFDQIVERLHHVHFLRLCSAGRINGKIERVVERVRKLVQTQQRLPALDLKHIVQHVLVLQNPQLARLLQLQVVESILVAFKRHVLEAMRDALVAHLRLPVLPFWRIHNLLDLNHKSL